MNFENKGGGMSEKKITESQMKYFVENFTRIPTLSKESDHSGNTKKPCPNGSEDMSNMCIPASFDITQSTSDQNIVFSEVLGFCGCEKCNIICDLNEEEFRSFTNNKLSFSEFLKKLPQ